MIDTLSLHDSVFWLPENIDKKLSNRPASRSLGLAAATILDDLLRQASTNQSASTPPAHYKLPAIHSTLLTHSRDHDVKRRLYLAAALTPFRCITIPERKRLVPATEAVIREGLKVRNPDYFYP